MIVPDALLGVLGKALADAVSYREPQGNCADCDKAFEGQCAGRFSPDVKTSRPKGGRPRKAFEGQCAGHLSDQAWTGLYRGAARLLGITLES